MDCNCHWAISPNAAIGAGKFHWGLQLLQEDFTEGCSCYWIISQGVALAAG
jgi:hypothetical protein